VSRRHRRPYGVICACALCGRPHRWTYASCVLFATVRHLARVACALRVPRMSRGGVAIACGRVDRRGRRNLNRGGGARSDGRADGLYPYPTPHQLGHLSINRANIPWTGGGADALGRDSGFCPSCSSPTFACSAQVRAQSPRGPWCRPSLIKLQWVEVEVEVELVDRAKVRVRASLARGRSVLTSPPAPAAKQQAPPKIFRCSSLVHHTFANALARPHRLSQLLRHAFSVMRA
jgi:hypothetical protein